MDYSQTLSSLIAGLIGAAVSTITFYGKARAERRRVVSMALADLLEVRHKTVGVTIVLAKIRTHVELPVEFDPIVAQLWERMYPLDPNLHKRFGAAVDLLAGIDPLLAFEMRSKNLAPNLLDAARAQGLVAQLDAKAIGEIHSAMSDVVAPALDRAVQTLADAHSWMTGRRVRAYLKEGPGMPAEFDQMIKQLMAGIGAGRASI